MMRHKSHETHGFTLIEVMIALVIFAILASITASSMYYAFDTRKRVTRAADAVNAIELATSLLKQDTIQAIARHSIGNEMHVFSPFIGLPDYFEFTRDGLLNPESIEQRSTLRRIAYLCKGQKLIRRSWQRTDSPIRHHQDRVLLAHLDKCAFAYVTSSRQMVPQWQEDDAYSQNTIPMPIAVQVTLNWRSFGNMSLLFTFPEALYDAQIKR